MRPTLAAIALLTALAPPALAEDVEHPLYRSWADKPVGTSVTLRSTNVGPGGTLTTTTTMTLLERSANKVVVETRKVSDATGEVVRGLPDKVNIMRNFPLLPGIKREDVGRPPKDAMAKGEETLTVAGREIKTFWYETRTRDPEAGDLQVRTWLSDELPNRLVKMVTKIPRANTTVMVELVGYETPTP